MSAISIYLGIVRTLRCYLRLGPWQATKLVLLAKHLDREFQIRVPGFKHRVHIRGRTSDAWVFKEIIIRRQYEGFGPPNPCSILDGGANIGLATLFWSRINPSAEIVAVEPDEDNFRMLSKNTAHLKNVTLVKGGIWFRDTNLSIDIVEAEKYELRVVENPAGNVKALSIPSIMKQIGWERIDLLKLDVEGSEAAILGQDAKAWVNSVGTLVIELHQGVAPDAAQKLFAAYSDQDVHLEWRGENLVLTRRKTAFDSQLTADGGSV